MTTEKRRDQAPEVPRLLVVSPEMLPADTASGGKSYAVPYQGRCTDDGDFGEASVWCSPEGNWTITCKISNHSMWCHKYKASCAMVYPQGGQLVTIAQVETNVIELCGHHAENIASNSGNTQSIKDGYNSIVGFLFYWHQLE